MEATDAKNIFGKELVNMCYGWVSVHRQLQKHWLWEDKPFSKGQAWIDLLMLANHADKKIMLGNELIEVKTGSFISSEVKLAERWGWSRTKVRSFLAVLEHEEMLVKKSDNKKTALTIVNYSDYQVLETAEKHQKNSKKTSKKQQKNTNNNDNNDNNDNKSIYKYIVDYLNQKANANFKVSTKKTQTCIHARLEEGFALEDFKTVIDKKCAEWKGTEWEKYLRPETLFGPKFEGYLNAKVTTKKTSVAVSSEPDILDDVLS